jgi:hypothetical protein
MEKWHEIICDCNELETENGFTGVGTDCDCTITKVKGDEVIQEHITTAMADLRKVI